MQFCFIVISRSRFKRESMLVHACTFFDHFHVLLVVDVFLYLINFVNGVFN